MRSCSKIKQSCRTVFTKQLSLDNLAVMSIIMNYLPKSNGKDNYLKSRFCLSCKNDEMSLRPFWHNTVDIARRRGDRFDDWLRPIRNHATAQRRRCAVVGRCVVSTDPVAWCYPPCARTVPSAPEIVIPRARAHGK